MIFQSRRFRMACLSYRLRQEFMAPYTPEQNEIIGRLFWNPKEECVRLRNSRTFAEARRLVARWSVWYNTLRPHESLDYRSLDEFRAQQLASVA